MRSPRSARFDDEVLARLDAYVRTRPRATLSSIVNELVDVTGLSRRQVRAAVRHYAAHPEEIDARVAANRAAAEREERLWRAEQSVLRLDAS